MLHEDIALCSFDSVVIPFTFQVVGLEVLSPIIHAEMNDQKLTFLFLKNVLWPVSFIESKVIVNASLIFLVLPSGISLVHQEVSIVTELVRGRRESGMSEGERDVSA